VVLGRVPGKPRRRADHVQAAHGPIRSTKV
jgi:hypothetical protein